MGKVTVLPETTKEPISLIGRRAGICWGTDIADSEKNYKRGLNCIKSNHGRALEFPNIEVFIEGYSARVIREWYTHIGGMPTRLQSSTRYINYDNFDYITPKSISSKETTLKTYEETMRLISKVMKAFESFGVPREDIANVLPLGMATNVVDKRDFRNVIDMSRNRMCNRAYWEFRNELFKDYIEALREYSDEWKTIIEMTIKPKCEELGYCPEERGCGKYPKRDN